MTPEREAAIVQLLRTRDEHLPEPVRRSEISSGFVHGLDPKGKPWRWLSCPDCLTNDRTMYGCETCGGSGRVPDPGRDPMAETKTVAYGADGSRHDQAYERDRQIESLGRQLRPAPTEAQLLKEANERGFDWEEARRMMYRRFDYGALDSALDGLRLVDDDAYRALHAVYVYGWLAEASTVVEATCARGLRWLDAKLPDLLRAPGVAAPVANLSARGRVADPRALEQRDAAIVAALATSSTREVAARFGLSVSQVNRIVSKRSAQAA